MLQPKKPLDLSSAKEILAEERKPLDLSSAESILKKKDGAKPELPSTTQAANTDSVQKDGSLDFPKLQSPTDIVLEGNRQIAQIPPKPEDQAKEIEEEKRSFLAETFAKLRAGSAQLGVDLASAPELLYDVFSAPQNYIAKKFNIPSLATDAEKFKDNIGVQNAVKEYYKQDVANIRKESELLDKQYQQGIYDSFASGNYEDGFRQLTNSFSESLPATTSIMVGGAYAKAPQILTASTMVFGAGKNEQLKDENPEMDANMRIANALGTGLAQGAFETIGSGSIGSAAKALVQREGTKKGATILKDGLVNFYKESLKKNPMLASVSGEGIEEWATTVTENSIDVATGKKPQDFNVFEGSVDSFISGAFGGSVFGAGLKGIDKITSEQDRNVVKQNFKKTFELQKQLENPNVSEPVKQEMQKAIGEISKQSQSIIANSVKSVNKLPETVKNKLVESVNKIDEISKKVEEVKLDTNTSDASKQILLDGLKKEYQDALNSKNDIIDGKVSEVDVLPIKAQDKIKREALKELTAELNPDGTKNIEITNEQITERANKLYKKQQETEIKDAEIQKPTIQEVEITQPQAEVQKTEQEVLTNETQESRTVIDDGIIRPTVSENADVAITEKPTSEVAETEVVESAVEPIATKGDSKVEYAKQEIEKGILQWSGDMGQPRIDLGLSWADIRKGEADIKRGKENSVPAKRLIEAIEKAKSEGGYRYKYGSGTENARAQDFVTFEDMQRVTNEMKLTDAEMSEINSNEEQLAKEYDEYFNSLDENTQNEILENYENRQPTEIGENAEVGKSEANVSNEEKPTRKESRKQAVEVKIDEIANSLKGLESIYGIRIKAQTDGTNTQGTSRDQLIDFIAKTAKEIAKTGIEIDEAIRSVISELRKSYDVDIEIDEIKNVVEPKVEEVPATFERKQGKKSLLTRTATGNDSAIKKAISKYSLDYEVESQEVAKNNADAFVEEVGIQTALEAVRSGKIVGAEKAFVYAKIIDEITNNITQYNEEEIAQLERLNVEILGEIAKEFDQESRNAGRFISALGAIYNGSLGRYNLSKQIADYKALNDGVIPDDILQKFKEADIRIKELETKLAELQKEKDAQEAEQQFQNIVESIARKNKLPRNRGISNTQKAKELADKLRSFKTTGGGSLSAATPMSLAYDGAIEVAATILENGGKLADAIKKGIDSIKGQKLDGTEESQALNDFLGAFDNLEPKGRNINIDETGKLKIPHSLIREHVENGIDNIDDLVKAISQDMKEILPEEEFTEREIRDAITQYGKISNPTKDDVEIQIGIMKSLGRLISGLEDAYSGKRPLRSGLQRRAMTLEERQMQRKLKELLRDLPMDDADLTRAWKTALDSIKSRLKNQIADLDKQIADGEKRKAEKKTIEYDEEAKALRDIRDQKRDLLDELVGKPELSMEEKIEKATILTQNSIDKLQEMIVTGEIDYKTKPTPVTSAKLEALREQRRQLRKQLEEMRVDAGLVEMKRLETAKKSRLNRIKELERRIKEKDFSVRTQKPLPIDAELLKIEEQLQEQKAIFEKEKHIFELKNRSKLRKLGTGIVNIIGITRLLKAGGEFSQVLVQQGFLTPEMLVRQPKEFFKAMYKLGKAFISPDSAKRYEAEMKSDPLYPLMQKTKLSLTGTDHRLDAQEENYQLDLITDTWNMIGEKLGDKKVKTIQGLIKSALGMTLTESDVKSIGQQFKESSPWKMFERGAVSYSNHIKMVKFAQGVKELQKQGKDPINDIEDYKKVAKYVNTFSGRANLGKAEMISKDAALLIFSLRNWYSQLQQLSPVFYSNLGDAKQWKNVKSLSDLKNIKPTVAQKMAVKSFMTSVIAITSFKVAFMAWANSMSDDDEEKWTLETDPRSSDFGKLRKGNKTFDLWHGLNGLLVFYSRLFTQETKSTKSGEIKPLGKGFGTPNSFELAVRYASNKLAPSAGYVARLAQTHEEVDPSTGEKYRVDPFGNVYGEKEMKDLFVPIYWSAVNEIRKEDPDVYETFLASIGILGMSVGTDPKGEKFKDIIGEQESGKRPSRPSAPKRPSRP